MSAFISFEISIPNRLPELVQRMRMLGYYNSWTASGRQYDLPQNCLWKPNVTPKAGLADLQECARQLNINITRCIVTTTNSWEGIPR